MGVIGLIMLFVRPTEDTVGVLGSTVVDLQTVRI